MNETVYPVKERYDIGDLLAIMEILRSENGCDWDKEQDHHSIRMNVLEEAYEVMEAIDAEDAPLLKEELGDLLLQVVFHAQMEKETGSFDFSGVCDGICKKLIYRHPHVFGDVKVKNSDEVLKNWDMLKSKSKGEETAGDRLESVPKLLPSLMRGEKVVKRAKNAGFQPIDEAGALDMLKAGASALEKAAAGDDSLVNSNEIEENLGDILFACCILSNFFKKDCEKALTSSINRFIMRFRVVERSVLEKGGDLRKMSGQELEELWRSAEGESDTDPTENNN